MSKECPECKKVIETCKCGEWDCAFHLHLRNECPSDRGARYREQVKASVEKRDKERKNV